ncbi:MAG: hypothetical protein V4579_03240 [Pseudomonadota bacterium]
MTLAGFDAMTRSLSGAAIMLICALVGGCVKFRTVDDGISRARINESVTVGPATVMPLAILEDSRCPVGVQCIAAGRVRLAVRIDPSGASELGTDSPAGVAGGTVSLVEVYPARRPDVTLYPDEYRFGFRFSPRP